MFYQNIVRDSFRHHYILIPARYHDPGCGIEPLNFRNLEYTRRFVESLHVPAGYWQRIIANKGMHRVTENELKWEASRLLLYQSYRVLPVIPPEISQVDAASRTLKQDDVIYQIRHASVVLLEKPSVKGFNSIDEARAFLQPFELDETHLGLLIREGDRRTWPDAWDRDRLIEKLAEQIMEGKMLITRQPVVKPAKVEEIVDITENDVGNRRAGLGPGPMDGLHNQEWDKVEVKDNSFKTAKEVDMDNLAEDEKTAVRALKKQGRNEEQIAQMLESGDNFSTKELKPGDKLYGFDSSANKYGAKKQDSMYWLDEAGYKDVKSRYYKNGNWDREGVKNYLALPCMNRADVVDMAEVTAPQKAIESTVGIAREQIAYSRGDYSTGMLGKIMPGGGKQITPDPAKTSAVTRLTGTP